MMAKTTEKIGTWLIKIESWISLALLFTGTGAISWLAYQVSALASHGWAAVVLLSFVISSTILIAVSMIYGAIHKWRELRSQRSVNVPIGASRTTGLLRIRFLDNEQHDPEELEAIHKFPLVYYDNAQDKARIIFFLERPHILNSARIFLNGQRQSDNALTCNMDFGGIVEIPTPSQNDLFEIKMKLGQ